MYEYILQKKKKLSETYTNPEGVYLVYSIQKYFGHV